VRLVALVQINQLVDPAHLHRLAPLQHTSAAWLVRLCFDSLVLVG
jgi:hypothetical protein